MTSALIDSSVTDVPEMSICKVVGGRCCSKACRHQPQHSACTMSQVSDVNRSFAGTSCEQRRAIPKSGFRKHSSFSRRPTSPAPVYHIAVAVESLQIALKVYTSVHMQTLQDEVESHPGIYSRRISGMAWSKDR
jgi:hypothetical protein